MCVDVFMNSLRFSLVFFAFQITMPSPRTAGRVYRYGRPSIYALIRVPHAHRARREPRVARPYRTKSLTNLTAFYRNRFYEIDRWYKARIVAPLNYPKCYEIDPEDFQLPLVDRLKGNFSEFNQCDLR